MKKKLSLPTNYNLYETSYGSEVPFLQLYTIFFDTIPSKFSPRMEYDDNVISHILSEGFEELSRHETSKKFRGAKISNLGNLKKSFEFNIVSDERILVHHEKKIFARVSIKKEDNDNIVIVDFLYDLSNGKILDQINISDYIRFVREKKKSNINLIKSDMGHLDTEEYQLNVPDMNLELNYGKSFLKVNDLILKRLNTENDKGIILLHGDPGTGKTSYIKYLTNNVAEKEILFIPPSMAETLSEPSIIPFLMEHKNSILIIEDAERVISDRETNGSSAGVSNILNLTDGILGDCLGIQIIATFNMKREKIDAALLRKGRLIVEHKFTALSVEETNNLLKSLGKDYISEEEMCLADIYNIDVETYKVINKNTKIGF